MLVLSDIQRHVLDVTMFHNMVNSVKLMHRSARCKRPTVHVLWYYSIYTIYVAVLMNCTAIC